MEDEDFLAAVEADNANAHVEDQPETDQPAPEAETSNRDERGRFKPKEEVQPEPVAAPEPSPAPEPQPAPPSPPEPAVAPITALLDEREKRRAAEAELERLRAAQQQPPQPVEVPDRDLDPEGYEAYQEARIQNILLNQSLNQSERFARREHGADTVEAAKQWAQQRIAADPLYHQQIIRDADPYEKLVTDYKRDQMLSQISDPSEIDEFKAWKAAKAQLQQQQGAPPPPPNPSPQIPPRSLASAPSAGGIGDAPIQSDDEIFAEIMPKR